MNLEEWATAMPTDDTRRLRAIFLRQQARWEVEELAYKKQFDQVEESGDDHPRVADVYNNMAGVYKKKGKYKEALAKYEKALSIYLKKLETTILMLL